LDYVSAYIEERDWADSEPLLADIAKYREAMISDYEALRKIDIDDYNKLHDKLAACKKALGVADEGRSYANELLTQKAQELAACEKECEEQARLNGMGSEREARLLARVEELQQILRDAYEVYAGSEGIPMPETAAEAYVYQLLMQMKDEIARGLK
jgi:antirestriction protein